MIDFSQWENRRLSVDSIRLDRRNPRLAGDSTLNYNQSEILSLLLEQADVRDIARRVQQNGYFPFMPPIVVKEGKYFVVIEGNRRIAALKLLRNPELSTPSSRRFFTGLASDFDPTSIEKIDVLISPKREDADPILYTIHASQSAKPWSRVMKQRFIAGQISNKASLTEIAAKFNVPESAIREAAIEILLLDLAKSFDLSEDIKDKIFSEDFPLSTLNRLMSTAMFGKITGFKLGDASFSTSIPEEQFRAYMVRIFYDLATGTQNSRKLDDEASRSNYLIELQNEYIDADQVGSWTYEPAIEMPADQAVEPRVRRQYRARQKLVPVTAAVVTGNCKLDALIEEGQFMPLGTYRNSAAMLLRTILQLAICQVMTEHGEDKHIRTNKGNVKGFAELLDGLIKSQNVPLSPSQRDQLQRFVSQDNPGYVNIRTLHDYVHDPYQQPDKVALHNFWSIIEPILQLCRKE